MFFLRKASFVFIWLFYLSFAFSQIETVSVNSKGYGDGPESALNSALTQAIGQVNGRSIDSDTLLTTTEKTSTKNDESDYLSSRDFKESIKSKTKGVVESYSIISNAKDDSGLWVAEITAQIARFKTSKSANRKRIAVIDLIGRQGCCLTAEGELNPDVAAYEVSSAISNFLVQSRKFTVLDRQYESETNTEQDRLSSDDVPITELAKLGQELVADYVLVGTINNLFLREQQRQMSTVDRTITTIAGNAAVSYRIIDVPTGQIKFSQTLNKNLNGKVKSITDPVQGALDTVSIVANDVGLKILETAYPFIVEKIEGENIVIGVGGDIIQVGQRYRLIQYGKKIVDSYTKESLGRKENIIGMVEITEVTPKMSYGKIINTNKENLESEFKPKSFIIRSLPESAQKKNLQKKADEKRKEIAEEFDEDW